MAVEGEVNQSSVDNIRLKKKSCLFLSGDNCPKRGTVLRKRGGHLKNIVNMIFPNPWETRKYFDIYTNYFYEHKSHQFHNFAISRLYVLCKSTKLPFWLEVSVHLKPFYGSPVTHVMPTFSFFSICMHSIIKIQKLLYFLKCLQQLSKVL